MIVLVFTYWCLRRGSALMVIITTTLSTVGILVKVFFYSFPDECVHHMLCSISSTVAGVVPTALCSWRRS